MNKKLIYLLVLLHFAATCLRLNAQSSVPSRERISLNKNWRFFKYQDTADKLIYDVRPDITDRNDSVAADSKPTESVTVASTNGVLKYWILPSANNFIKDTAKHHKQPAGSPGSDFPFVHNSFNDAVWEQINLPHDWAIKGPFYKGDNAIVSGGMGRLPIHGVAWYRKKINISAKDADKSFYLDIDGAMSYAMVWVNGKLAGGWPYGYNSFRINLTPYIKIGENNQLAIRLDNPLNSARWYSGGGIYRNVWLTKVATTHIAQWGTTVNTSNVSAKLAKVNIAVNIENTSSSDKLIRIQTNVYLLGNGKQPSIGKKVASFSAQTITIKAGANTTITNQTLIQNPQLWGPLPTQQPNLYKAITKLYENSKEQDVYETVFGIRSLKFNPNNGLLVNGEKIYIKGVNQHHDLGALGAAFNVRAAERQLQILQELGCNAIRLSHNPPAPELLELTDKMGFLVIDEVFDSWERKKTPLDFHLIFPDWYEADLRSFIRRDKNHPSVIAWSFGNEVGEQYTGQAGAALAKKLYNIVKDEDSTRPATTSINYAKPDMPFSQQTDIISLNYQGEGIRNAAAYAGLKGIRTSPLYPSFHKQFPNKLIVSSETASLLSTRGTYIFPVTKYNSAPANDTSGGDPINHYVSAYELYTAPFGASADKVFATQDQHPYVAGEFVWTGWDYIGEPTPYYSARSSYCGIIDLAGFKKDRFYQYQSRWKPNLKMAHILPHWSWPERLGQITPVHVFSAADEAELFVNNISVGRQKRGKYEYRFHWDSVKYQPGELRVVTYKNGKFWAANTVKTAGEPAKLQLESDRQVITADGEDLAFITLTVKDAKGAIAPRANNTIQFEITGAGEIVATDNGDPTDLVAFADKQRKAFNGLALAIVRTKEKVKGNITITAKSAGLTVATTTIQAK
ncbi:MAG: beta-galactosidase GalB [Flavobacterium sp.]|nr:beta-galactosidase GalB [Flavobacterium sp.]